MNKGVISTDIEVVEKLTGGAYFRIDLTKGIVSHSEKCIELLGLGKDITMNLAQHLEAISQFKVVVDDEIIDISKTDGLNQIYKIDYISEVSNGEFIVMGYTPNGKIYFKVSYVAYTNDNIPTHIDAIAIDVTQEKENNYKAKVINEKISIAEETSNSSSWEVDFKNNTIWMSKNTSVVKSLNQNEDLYLPLDEAMNTFSDVATGKFRKNGKTYSTFEDFFELLEIGQRTESTYVIEYEEIYGDEVLNMQTTVRPTFEDGEISKLLVVAKNVTEEMNKTNEVIALNNRFNFAEYVSSTGTYEINLIEDTIWLSKNCSKLYELDEYTDDFIPFEIYSNFDAFKKMATEQNEETIIATDFKNFREMWFVDALIDNGMHNNFAHKYYIDGDEKKYFENKYSVTIENEIPIKIIGSIKNISEDIAKERELVKMKENIEISHEKIKCTEHISKSGSWEYDIINEVFEFSVNYQTLRGIINDKAIKLSSKEYLKIYNGVSYNEDGEERYIHGDFDDFFFIDKINEATDENTTYIREYSITNDEIGIKYNKAIFKPIFENGVFVKILGVTTDITDEKTRELRIHEAFDKLNLAENILGSYSWEYNITEQTVWLSKNSPTVKALGKERAITIPFNDFIEDFANSKAQFVHKDKVVTTKEDFLDLYSLHYDEENKIVEYQIVAGDKVSHIRAYINNLSSNNKNRLLVTCIDVTLEKEKQKELEEQRNKSLENAEKLLIAEDIALCGSWEYDVIKKMLSFSKNSLKRMGIDIDEGYKEISSQEYIEIIKNIYTVTTPSGAVKTVSDFNACDPILQVFGIDDKYLENAKGISETYHVEYKNNLKNITVVNYARPAIENGKLVKLIGATKDVTIERAREQELIIAKEQAEEATQQQSRFVANMSHEIRTPLNAILGYAEIMKEQNLDLKLSTYLKSIDTAGNSLLSLVNDILDYSKVKAGKFNANYIPSNIGDFSEELKVLFYHKITQKNLDFEIIYDTELPTFMLPVATIRQVLINILGNASKFTHEGSIILKTVASPNDDNTYDVDFVVADTGIGIAKNKQEMIFKEFEQADTSHEKTGTGLGLALSVNFAKLVGGRISIESEEGKGSIFTLHMKNVGLASYEIQAMHKTKANEKLKFFGQKALVLDDIIDNREVLSAHCEYMNLEAKSFETGGEALIGMKRYKPDVILTDLRMPTMNGEEFAKNVRALDEFKNTPIICITASINPEENYHLENFNEVLNKPISSQKLAMAISKYLAFENANENMLEVKEFNLQIAYRSLEMKDEDFDRFKNSFYEDLVALKVALNPKRIKDGIGKVLDFAKETNNETLERIAINTRNYCDSLDISNMMESVTLMAKFLESK